MTRHLHFIAEVWGSHVHLIFFNKLPGFQLRHPRCRYFVSSGRRRGSPADWSAFSLSHVSFKEEMINVRLQVGGREASDGGEWHFMDRFSRLLVWSICWAFLCMVSWQMKGFIQKHISFEAGNSNSRLHFTILCIHLNWDKLDKTCLLQSGSLDILIKFPTTHTIKVHLVQLNVYLTVVILLNYSLRYVFL